MTTQSTPPAQHCSVCGRRFEAPCEDIRPRYWLGIAYAPVRRCPRCVIVSALLDAQAKMNYAAGLMIRHGGDYEPHGREMRGAARVIEGWLNEIGKP